ncbi:hypothetical protein C5Y97_03315 [Blastopirellula marina]|uniref:BLUF domain-containing protein n=1 Tax=Blastopirellula marina TaxID=124 RepID=A0A2S8GBC9_9BACT|nr:hypothetical protein C5Y98_03315 [Blastopirellula marina]PTL46205.1 hypothetical protein C5Y97_03315 [Blastopirellula marina]
MIVVRKAERDSRVFALAYASYSTVDAPNLDLEGIATHASAKNASLGITGYLCYDHGVFFQYLEGEQKAVLGLMDVIEKDTRHDVINKVMLGEHEQRIFPDWSMRHLNRSDLRRVDLENVLEHSLFHMDPKLYGHDNIVALIRALVANIAARQAQLKVV